MPLHEIIAGILALHFLRHLHEELAKSPALIDAVRFDGRTARDINMELVRRVHRDFPDLRDEEVPEFNFIRKWTSLNQFHLAYEDFAFEAYNLIFYERILCIRAWSPESVARFHEHTISIFEKFNISQEGFSVSFFMRTENNMREILREILAGIADIDQEAAWNLVFEQSKAYQEVVNMHFERLLKQALARSEELLHNILPVSVAEELKERGRVEPVHIDSATVLFTDFKGFTIASERMSPRELVAELDGCFSVFDRITEKYGLEKIKTIGDSYMCAGGLPVPNQTHAIDVALAALEMHDSMVSMRAAREAVGKPFWDARIGFHSGPLVAGVIAKKKFSYDVWGDTVNTASRMESSGEPGRVNLSADAHELIKYLFESEYRGMVAAKNKGDMGMYFLTGIRKRFSVNGDGRTPNDLFWNVYGKITDGARFVPAGNGKVVLENS